MNGRSIRAWAILRNGKLSAREIYDSKDIILAPGEKLVRVIISCEKKK